MKLNELVENLKLVPLTQLALERIVEGVYIGDLLSLVMAKAKKNNCWLTVQTHLNVIAIASLLELAAVIIVEGQEVEDETILKANEEGIIVLRSELPAYELAIQIAQYLK
jgi:predicted transcriptional regulator